MNPNIDMTPLALENRAGLVSEVSEYIDEMYGDHPMVVVLADDSQVVAAYSRTELHVHVTSSVQGLKRHGTNGTTFQTPTVADALQFLAEVEALRQKTDFPFLRFFRRQGAKF